MEVGKISSGLDWIHGCNLDDILTKSLQSVRRAAEQRKRSLVLTLLLWDHRGKRCEIPFYSLEVFHSRTRKWSKVWSSNVENVDLPERCRVQGSKKKAFQKPIVNFSHFKGVSAAPFSCNKSLVFSWFAIEWKKKISINILWSTKQSGTWFVYKRFCRNEIIVK